MFYLDGGGVRGLTTLLILKRMMYLIRPNDDDYQLPKPCEYFDLIAGTSTGGLIAIMLGKLVRIHSDCIQVLVVTGEKEMDVQTCIDRYKTLAEDIFQPRKRTYVLGRLASNIVGHAAFSASKLRDSVKKILTSVDPPLSESALLLSDSSARCKM